MADTCSVTAAQRMSGTSLCLPRCCDWSEEQMCVLVRQSLKGSHRAIFQSSSFLKTYPCSCPGCWTVLGIDKASFGKSCSCASATAQALSHQPHCSPCATLRAGPGSQQQPSVLHCFKATWHSPGCALPSSSQTCRDLLFDSHVVLAKCVPLRMSLSKSALVWILLFQRPAGCHESLCICWYEAVKANWPHRTWALLTEWLYPVAALLKPAQVMVQMTGGDCPKELNCI